MLWDALKHAGDWGRLHHIASVLIRYGFGDLVHKAGLARALEQAGEILHWKHARQLSDMGSAERLRRALEELGPTFVKLGQLLATRVDLLPPDWVVELEKLQDTVPAVAFDELKPQLEEDLGAPPEEVFATLATEPIAAASIAQVHRASLADGQQVVLKIRRPGIRRQIESDLRLMARFAEALERNVAEARRFRPTELLRQFTRSLRRELDLAQEMRNAERIAANFSGDARIVIPRCYWQWTGERLNVQRYVEGIRGRDLDAVDAAGLNRRHLAALGAEAVLNMVIRDGLFHADPHLGNCFFLSEERIAFVDFGMVGRLADDRRDQVLALFYGLVNRRTDSVVDILVEWAGDNAIDSDALAVDVDGFLDTYHGLALQALNISAMLGDLLVIMREHELVLPPDLALLIKVFITLDGVGRRLDPDFNVVEQVSPLLTQAMAQRYHPEQLFKRGVRHLNQLALIAGDLPRDMRKLLKAVRRGALQIHVDVTHLERFGHQLDRAASRITVGLVTAALIVGTAIVATIPVKDTLFGLPLLGLLGFIGAALGGAWLLLSIWRGRKN